VHQVGFYYTDVFNSQKKRPNQIISYCGPFLAIPISTIPSGFYTRINVKCETLARDWDACTFLNTSFILSV